MISILIIDDDKYMCALLQNFLVSKGCAVEVTYNGFDGVKVFKERKFDVVLCDFVLPDIQGNWVLSQIKAVNKETVVIIITGYPNSEAAADVMKKGAYDYLQKPINPDEIFSVIEKSLAGVPPQNSFMEKN